MKDNSRQIIKNMSDKIGLIIHALNQNRTILYLILIISYVLFYFLIDLSSQSLVAHDEGLYARRSRLVEDSANWLSPPFDKPHHKTIGSYWLISLSIRLFGFSELSLRLPSILSSFVCLIITYSIASIISNRLSALISVFALSSMPLWIQYSRYASPDIPFVLCILLVILCFLKFIDSSIFINKNFYIFISGIFLSLAFFVRSYMAFVPLFGLSPFLVINFLRARNIFKIVFISGILFGSVPTLLNLYFAFNLFGTRGITSLFDFAKKQAIGGFDINNSLLIPINAIYFTFPVGVLLIIFFILTRSNNNYRYPLLTYYYPFLSLLILLFMSTTYSHYFLFLLPSLSILFAVNLQNLSFRFRLSEKILKYALLSFIIIIFISIIIFIIFYFDHLLQLSNNKTLLVLTVLLILALSYISSSRFLFNNIINRFNILKFLFNIIIPQYIALSLLYNFGIIGSPNLAIKSFLTDSYVSKIVKSNIIGLYNVDSKIQTLLSYYLPSSIIIKNIDDISMYKYVITTDNFFINTFKEDSSFESIKNFDSQFYLINLRK
tara:strand:- start:535 stop:2184 length:1650 start_codon:yes stop_codon:yes gene_type:complete